MIPLISLQVVNLTGDGEIKLSIMSGGKSEKPCLVLQFSMTSQSPVSPLTEIAREIPTYLSEKAYYAFFEFRRAVMCYLMMLLLNMEKSDGIIFRNGKHLTVTNCIINKMGT